MDAVAILTRAAAVGLTWSMFDLTEPATAEG